MGTLTRARGDFVPPSRTPLFVRDAWGAIPPQEIRTPPPRFPGDPGFGASLRARSRLPGSREDGLTHRAEPVLTATSALTRFGAASLLAVAGAALLSVAALAADPTPAPSPSPDCGVTALKNCLDTPTTDLTQTIWSSMSGLVSDAARNVVQSLGCELVATGTPSPATSTPPAPGVQCTAQATNGGLSAPDLTGTYFTPFYQRAAVVAALIAMGVGMAAAAFFAVTRNGVRLIYAGIGYPALVAIGIVAAPGVLATVLRLTDDLGFYVAGPVQVSNALNNLAGIYQYPPPSGATVAGAPPPIFVVMVTSLAAMLFGMVALVEVLARSVAIYLVVLFWPLALAGSAWGAGFAFARRFLKVILAVILAKPVMVIVISFGIGLIATRALDLISMVEGVMILLVALLAPLVPFAMLGGAEAAIGGQLQLQQRLETALGAGGVEAAGGQAQSPAGGGAGGSANGTGGDRAGASGATPVVAAIGNGRGRSILQKSTDGSVEESARA
jgi:hypothetical protein